MQPLRVRIDSQLEEPGGYMALSGDIDCKSYDVGPLSYTFADGLHYEVSLSNTETSILLCGHLTGTVMKSGLTT